MLKLVKIDDAEAYYYNGAPLALYKNDCYRIKHKLRLRNIDKKLALKIALQVLDSDVDKAYNVIYKYSQDYEFEYFMIGSWIPSLVLFDNRI